MKCSQLQTTPHPALHELLAGHLEGPSPGDERLALEHHVDGHQDDAHHLPGDALVPVEQVDQPQLDGNQLPVQLATPLQEQEVLALSRGRALFKHFQTKQVLCVLAY